MSDKNVIDVNGIVVTFFYLLVRHTDKTFLVTLMYSYDSMNNIVWTSINNIELQSIRWLSRDATYCWFKLEQLTESDEYAICISEDAIYREMKQNEKRSRGRYGQIEF